MELEAILVHLERQLADKISSASYTTKITEGGSSLSTLESNLAALNSLTNLLDDERHLIKPVEASMDCKISLVDYQAKITTASASIDTVVSDLARITVDMNDLETGVSMLL